MTESRHLKGIQHDIFRDISREVTQTVLPLEVYPFRLAPLLIEPIIPNNMLIMRHPVRTNYSLKNLTSEVMELKVVVDRAENDHLMFDGFAEVDPLSWYFKYLLV